MKPIKVFKDSFEHAMNTNENINIFKGALNTDDEKQLELFSASTNMHKGQTLNVHSNFQLLSFMLK